MTETPNGWSGELLDEQDFEEFSNGEFGGYYTFRWENSNYGIEGEYAQIDMYWDKGGYHIVQLWQYDYEEGYEEVQSHYYERSRQYDTIQEASRAVEQLMFRNSY